MVDVHQNQQPQNNRTYGLHLPKANDHYCSFVRNLLMKGAANSDLRKTTNANEHRLDRLCFSTKDESGAGEN